jgi:chaperonin GroES
MNLENVIYKLRRALDNRINSLSISITSGGVDNMETYKYIIGKTKGGVLLGQGTIDKQQVASQCGNVIAMGDACYKDKERYPLGPWCKVGDWVIFARYAGSRIEIEGGEVRLLNEDEVLATVQDPTDILHKF